MTELAHPLAPGVSRALPDSPGVISAARAADVASRAGAVAERERRIDVRTVQALTEAGFARHFVPRRWGGGEGAFTELFDAAVEVAEGCASAAWCGVLWAGHGRFAAFLPEEGQRDLWEESPDVRISAAVVPPAGSAESVPGGWRVQGNWRFASGVDHADWLLVAVPEPREAGAQVLVLAVPREELRIVDSWNSVGLRGTGSHEVVLRSAFVPERRSFEMGRMMNGDARLGRARCYAAPAQLVGGVLMMAPALGAARRALRVWSDLVVGKAAKGAADFAVPVWEALARSSAELDAAALLLREVARRADREPRAEGGVAHGRRDAAVAAELVVTAVERLFRTGGSHGGCAEGELQRAWRDVHTATGHAALRLGSAAEAYGRATAAVLAQGR
ncbi:acyl-CoA dehydrogenase family protein [Streptomyces sioyaensis]|uniref:acyl-CoA dehydrogenase family protein n=1 Tax=Streptomyces sioyaensis TaxID=67364 RepID=UPI003D756B3F